MINYLRTWSVSLKAAHPITAQLVACSTVITSVTVCDANDKPDISLDADLINSRSSATRERHQPAAVW
jgi:hypothetical protein